MRNEKKHAFKLCYRAGGFVCWFPKKDGQISVGDSGDSSYIEMDNPDFFKALEIAKKNEDKFVVVYPREEEDSLPKNMEIEKSSMR